VPCCRPLISFSRASFAIDTASYVPIMAMVCPLTESWAPVSCSMILLAFPSLPMILPSTLRISASFLPKNSWRSMIPSVKSSIRRLKARSGENPLPIAWTRSFARRALEGSGEFSLRPMSTFPDSLSMVRFTKRLSWIRDFVEPFGPTRTPIRSLGMMALTLVSECIVSLAPE